MKREENESFEDYKKRRLIENKAVKIYRKGAWTWNSTTMGTRVALSKEEDSK